MPSRHEAHAISSALPHSARPSISWIALSSLTALCIVAALVLARAGDRHRIPLEMFRAPLTNVEAKAYALAAALASDCPPAAADDLAALDRCRMRLHGSAVLRPSLGAITLWGRERDRARPLADGELAQLSSATLAGTYLPLFVFDGRVAVAWSAGEGLWRLELGAQLRKRDGRRDGLDALQSPLRIEDDLSAGLERTEALVVWLEADARLIFAVQAVTREPPSAEAGSLR